VWSGRHNCTFHVLRVKKLVKIGAHYHKIKTAALLFWRNLYVMAENGWSVDGWLLYKRCKHWRLWWDCTKLQCLLSTGFIWHTDRQTVINQHQFVVNSTHTTIRRALSIVGLTGWMKVKRKVNINLLQHTQPRQDASEVLRYMASTKQRHTYLLYTFPDVAGTHLLTMKGWRVE